MIFAEFLRAAFISLRYNPLRSLLTILGIVIGVSSVITLTSLGISTRTQIDAQIGALGSNQLIAFTRDTRRGREQAGAGARSRLREGDVDALKREIPEIAAAAGAISARLPVIWGARSWLTTLQGADSEYLVAREWQIAEGRSPSLEEMRHAARVAVLGSTVARILFGDGTALGRIVRLNQVPVEVIGVLAEKGNAGGMEDQNDLILTPLSTARRRLVGNHPAITDSVDVIVARVTDAADIPWAKIEVADLLSQRRHIARSSDAPFSVLSMTDSLETRLAAVEQLNQLLVAVAAVSLLVGGIGIMNMMLVSVTERTREIGVLRAIGARKKDILGQVLVEAGVLSALGGGIGVVVAVAASSGLSAIAGLPIVIDLGVIALAVVFSALIGMLFGYYPARIAAAKSPIQAIRQE